MEKKRPNKSVGFFAYARTNCADAKGFSPIFITAALSVAVLFAVVGWEVTGSLNATNAPARISGVPLVDTAPSFANSTGAGTTDAGTSTDPISKIGDAVMRQLTGAYEQMRRDGAYSSSTAALVGQSLAPYVAASAPYRAVTASEIKTDPDTSYARMLKYRSDLRASLSPLLKNTQPEYEIFAYYVETRDASYLAKLRAVAQEYAEAASSTSQVVAPSDAVSYHVAIVNAMEEFGATLAALAAHADDPFASVALLRGYNQAEYDMLSSFKSLTVYYKGKLP